MPEKRQSILERAPVRSEGHSFSTSPICGTGVGLRTPHIQEFINGKVPVPWLEVLSDNYFAEGGILHQQLEAIRQHYPIALHSVGMSIGSTDPLDMVYFKNIKRLADRYQPQWVSDHLCFTSASGIQSHDLLPLPFTEEAVYHTAKRITQIQDFLERPLLIENVSSYLRYKHSTMSEGDFIRAIVEEANCFVLLDINNAYVNQENHGEEALAFINAIPQERIQQVHLGGYQAKPKFLLDAHNHAVSDPVWELFTQFVKRVPDVPTLIEWDNDIPTLEILLTQARKAQQIIDEAVNTLMR